MNETGEKLPKDKAGGRLSRAPVVTLGIIALNIAAALITRADMHYYSDVYVRAYGLIPAALKPGSLFTSAFLHDGYFHLGMNMLLLYVFGSRVEQVMGKLEYVMFYIGACFVSSLTHVGIVYASLPPYYETRAVVGASGAVAGVMGIYAVRYHRRVFRFWGMEISALLLIAAWLMLQLVLGILGLYRDQFFGLGLKEVGYWSHLGGFVFGVVIALLANMALDGEREYLSEQAREQYTQGAYLEAIRSHETIVKYDPGCADSHAEIGRLWALLEERDDSLRHYRLAITLYAAQGRENRALEAADEMERFWPGTRLSPVVRYRLAGYLADTGQTTRALGVLREIVDLTPESLEAQMSLVRIAQIQLSALHDRAACEETIDRLLASYPDTDFRPFAQRLLA